jgi:phosphatidylethanolamine-binding protein (PEBP) family uncharacterized protein
LKETKVGGPFFRSFVFENPDWDWTTMDFDKDMAFAEKKLGAIVDNYDPDLSKFKAAGGKLLQYHGWADAQPSPMTTVDYFENVQKKVGDTQAFYRLFMVPGMGHCGGGPGTDQFEKMGSLTDWVEHGKRRTRSWPRTSRMERWTALDRSVRIRRWQSTRAPAAPMMRRTSSVPSRNFSMPEAMSTSRVRVSKEKRIMSIRLSIGVLAGALLSCNCNRGLSPGRSSLPVSRGPGGQRPPGGQQGPSIGHTQGLAIVTLPPKSPMQLTVTSPAFKDGGDIPYENTQYRGNIFPGLSWTKGPAGTRSYAVVVQDGTSPIRTGTASTHFTLFNIPASVTTLKAGMTSPPAGATYGENIHGINQSYAGPHTHSLAKSGTQFQVLALDTVFDLPPATTYSEMVTAMTGHVLASGVLTGMSGKDPDATDAPLRTVPVHLETGLVSGTVPAGIAPSWSTREFPTLLPPVGDLRFRAPQPPIAWNGVFKADTFGKNCPQGGGPGGGNKDNMSEDCLTANVWSGAAYPGEKRPVYVWIYGGGFTGGSGSNPEIDGEALAKKGVVVVTFNYRLGALGFLATPELSKESGHNASGNFGLLDDIACCSGSIRTSTRLAATPIA